MYYMCIICVFAGFCLFFLGFLCPRVFLSVFLLAFYGFSWVFCVRGVFCLCFCWLYVAFLGFFASAGFFVCVFAGFIWLYLAFLGFFASAGFFVFVFAGFIWLFLGFLRPRRFLSVLLLVLSGFSWVFCVRGDICMCFCWFFLSLWNPSWADLQLGFAQIGSWRTSNSGSMVSCWLAGRLAA